jgi:hypothetical protein
MYDQGHIAGVGRRMEIAKPVLIGMDHTSSDQTLETLSRYRRSETGGSA